MGSLLKCRAQALCIEDLTVAGVEADDVIGSLACRAVDEGIDAVIVSSDKVSHTYIWPKLQQLGANHPLH